MITIIIVGGRYHGHRFDNSPDEWNKRSDFVGEWVLRNLPLHNPPILIYPDQSLSREAAELALLTLDIPELEN